MQLEAVAQVPVVAAEAVPTPPPPPPQLAKDMHKVIEKNRDMNTLHICINRPLRTDKWKINTTIYNRILLSNNEI